MYLWAVKYFFPLFLSSFVVFAFGRLIFYKLDLVNEMAVGKMFEDEEEDEIKTQVSSPIKPGRSSEYFEIEMKSNNI